MEDIIRKCNFMVDLSNSHIIRKCNMQSNKNSPQLKLFIVVNEA